jgi:hypothetical protein
MRLRKAAVFHVSIFQELVATALHGRNFLCHQGTWWEPLETTPQFGLYREADNPLTLVQERLEWYETVIYGWLLGGYAGVDGSLRFRTQLWQNGDGTYRPLLAGTGAANYE